MEWKIYLNILRIYREGQDFNGKCMRSEETWRELFAEPEHEWVLEENGQIIPLGMRVFEKVCRMLAEGRVQSMGLECIEVNISAAQFDNENPAKFVIENITKYGIDPKMINLEITETAVNKAFDAGLETVL